MFREKEPGRYDAAAKIMRKLFDEKRTAPKTEINAELAKLGFSPLDRPQIDAVARRLNRNRNKD